MKLQLHNHDLIGRYMYLRIFQNRALIIIPVPGAACVDEGNAGAALRRIVPPLQTLIARSLDHGLQKII